MRENVKKPYNNLVQFYLIWYCCTINTFKRVPPKPYNYDFGQSRLILPFLKVHCWFFANSWLKNCWHGWGLNTQTLDLSSLSGTINQLVIWLFFTKFKQMSLNKKECSNLNYKRSNLKEYHLDPLPLFFTFSHFHLSWTFKYVELFRKQAKQTKSLKTSLVFKFKGMSVHMYVIYN